MFPINDLQRHTAPLLGEIEAALARVMRSGWFIMGREVEAFEREFAAWCGVPECIAVGNGTDALEIALRALGVGAGDRVAIVANAGAYGSIALASIGAVPVYVDIDEASLNMSPRALEGAVGGVKAVIATHLYGRMADVEKIGAIARANGVPLIEDCAQSHGAMALGKRCGSFGDLATFSFYPTKNLGAVGDGGAVVARDAALAARVRHLRQYGWTAKYLSTVAGGRNSRLDEAQAAVLRVKLPHVDSWNDRRRAIGARYASKLSNPHVAVPRRGGEGDIVHLYIVRAAKRDSLAAHLKAAGLGSDVHYPNPDYRQPAWSAFAPAQPLAATERACAEVLTLPCFPEMRDDEVDRVAEAVNAWRP
jgi:aminotransferase EvaB